MAKKEIELLSKRVQSLEILVKELKLEVVLKRIKFIEETLFSTKDILNAKEVCLYLDISQSLLYKLTSSGEIPHFKPRGKMVFFEKKELVEWIKQNPCYGSTDIIESPNPELNSTDNNEEDTQKEQH